MKIRKKMAVVAVSLAFLSCAAIPGAPPGGQEQAREEPRSLEERFVYQIVFSLRDSFAGRDGEAFMKHVSEGFYLGRQRLAASLAAEFASSAKESLQVEVLEVTVEDPRVTALVNWARIPAGGGAPSKEGTTELIFQKGETVSLVNFRKDALFGIAGF